MKKIISFIMVFLLLLTNFTYAIDVNIDGNSLEFSNQSGSPFVDKNNRTQVPLRVTMEGFGASVDWNDSKKTAIVKKDGIIVEVPIGKSYILKNGQKISNDTQAIIKDNRTYLPIRVVLESFGANVGWDNNSKTVIISELGELKIHFLDVGQADCILIELPTNEEILIDAGNKGDSSFIINYLNNVGIDDIEYFVLTHFHEDHIGSAPEILNSFEVNNIYMPDTTADTEIYNEVTESISSKDIDVVKAKGGTSIFNSSNLRFEVVGPNSMWYSEMNEFSLVTKLVYGDTSFLFTGDAESVSEFEMVRANYDLDVDLLKVGHHGGETSSSQIYIDEVTPEYAIISVGKDNTYGHPHDRALKRLNNIGAEIYRTDESGTIIAASNGKNILIDKSASTYTPVENSTKENVSTNKQEAIYIGNSNSFKLHYSNCSSVSKMSEKNKVSFLNKSDATNQGYIPCKICNP